MHDRRWVDDLTIEELEAVITERKRQAKAVRLRRLEQVGRRIPGNPSIYSVQESSGSPIAFESYLTCQKPSVIRSALRDRLLGAIELSSVVALILATIVFLLAQQQINQQAVLAQSEAIMSLPTASPTALIRPLVLPSGHKPPAVPGGDAEPNYGEVAPNYRAALEQYNSALVVPPADISKSAIRIRIPAINVDSPVVLGDGWEQLKLGVAQHPGTPNPGEDGNIVLSGHNDTYGEVFRYLDHLQEGDEVILYTTQRYYVYRVSYWRLVEPTEVSVMEPTSDPIVTLISCYPYLIDIQRIVVVAQLEE